MSDLANKNTVVILKKGEGRTIKAGGAWIYDNEIDRIEGDFTPGDIITVQDFDGYPMGYGFINPKSKITIRMMTRDANVTIDDTFLRNRVEAAWRYRKSVTDISSCRVIFGEADFLPGLVIDKYEDVLVVESLALGIDRLKPKILSFLTDALQKDGIRIRAIFERSDAKIREKEGLPRTKGLIRAEGTFDPKIRITENGVQYLVDVENGQKTGFFLDQKGNRMAMQQLVHRMKAAGETVRVLDCFTHTGSFALNCGLGGADSVLGIDVSETAVAQATENAELNGLTDRVRFEAADVLDLLPKLNAGNEKYDIVILDPPAFTKTR